MSTKPIECIRCGRKIEGDAFKIQSGIIFNNSFEPYQEVEPEIYYACRKCFNCF